MNIKNLVGCDNLQISVGGEDIIPKIPSTWSVPIRFINFSFMNQEACTIILNGKSKLTGQDNKIYLMANQGLNIFDDDVDVESFIIVEDGVPYNFVGKY